MLFTDAFFLFYFLPLALLAHRVSLVVSSRTQRYGYLPRLCFFGLTLIFYGLRQPWWLIPFFVCVGFDFLWASLLFRVQRPGGRKAILVASIIQNLSLLAIFKYWDLVIRSAGRVSPSIGAAMPVFLQNGNTLGLPAGISFYTFESLSFVIDSYIGRIEKKPRALDFFPFIGMFPRFIAGPIVRYQEIKSQYETYKGMNLERGLFLFIVGLFLKIAFADNFAVFTRYAFDRAGAMELTAAWTGVFAFAMQLYFDFSGYSLMAIGLGTCFGFSFPSNFNTPYLAGSLQDFWRRWHMTLGAWIRDYFFTPLAIALGRHSRFFIYPVMFFTMVVIGFWHGSNATYLAMGAWHGVFLCVEHGLALPKRIPRKIYQPFIFVVVLIGWVFFRAHKFSEVGHILKAMFAPSAGLLLNPEGLFAHPLSLAFCALGVFYCFAVEKKWNPMKVESLTISWTERLVASVMFVSSLILVLSSRIVPFLYFQF